LIGACTASEAPRRGQLMVALQTDMSIPKDVTHIRVKTKLGNEIREEFDFQIAPDGKFYIPGTIAIVEGSQPNPVVSVEVVGIRQKSNGDFEARTFSKTVTTIPRERTVLLEVPVQWLCDDTATDDGTGEFVSTCSAGDQGQERACVAGACEDVSVDGNALPDYKSPLVFGGGSSAGDPLARCFDTVACFDRGSDVVAKTSGNSCTFQVPDDGTPLNVGMRLPAGGDGICHDKNRAPCYVPLNQDEKWGWSFGDSAPSGKREVVLPAKVCDLVKSGEVEAVRITTACETKTSQYGTCGPWSSVSTSGSDGGTAGSGNGSAGRGGTGGTTAVGSAGANAVDSGGMAGASAGEVGAGGIDSGQAGASDGLANAGESSGVGGSSSSTGGKSSGTGGATATGGKASSAGSGGSAGSAGSGGSAGGTGTLADWTCAPSSYDGGDGCDCGCGALDPDCVGDSVGLCDTCDNAGSCATDLDATHTASSCYGIDLSHNWQCDASTPAWTCAPLAYGSGNACDCGCGIQDIDCTSSLASDCDDCSDPDSCTAGGDCTIIDTNDNSQCGGI
jgi:hypothetical protein